MTNSFLNVFGGITVYPSDLGLINLTITQNTTLVWPDLGETQSAVAASFIRATASAGLNFTMPDANKASVGKAIRFKNIGSSAFDVKSASGSTILTASAGQDWLLSITDNTTTGGAWDASQIGSGTTSANAAALAGAGLSVSGSQLVVSDTVTTFSSTPYAITATGRANLFEWQGGAGVVTFPSSGTINNGFYFLLKNQGSGVLTVSAVVDAGQFGTPLTLQPGGQGALFDWDGSAWHSFGYVNLSTLNLNSAYTKTLTTTSVSLTTTESQNNIITFAGTLIGNTTVNFPAITYLYDVTNSTTGAYTLTIKPTSGTGVTLSQGYSRMVVNNASTMYFADTISGGTLTQISTGTGLTGGPITGSGTIYLSNTTVTSGAYGTASQYPSITFNGQGQATSATGLPFSGLTMTGITLTGITAAPTVTAGDSSTSVATTAFVQTASGATFVNTTLTGNTVAVTQASGDSSTKVATTAFVTAAIPTVNATQTTINAPAAITSTSGKMLGLAGTITPVKSGTVQITICGTVNPVGGDFTFLIKTGTGSAPANGAAVTGTTRGNSLQGLFSGSAAVTFPFSMAALVSGLTLSTAIWIDISASATTGSTTVTNVCLIAIEVH